MLIRTHYCIDMVTGLIVAHYMHMLAEKISFFVDHKWLRIPQKERVRYHYKPCD